MSHRQCAGRGRPRGAPKIAPKGQRIGSAVNPAPDRQVRDPEAHRDDLRVDEHVDGAQVMAMGERPRRQLISCARVVPRDLRPVGEEGDGAALIDEGSELLADRPPELDGSMTDHPTLDDGGITQREKLVPSGPLHATVPSGRTLRSTFPELPTARERVVGRLLKGYRSIPRWRSRRGRLCPRREDEEEDRAVPNLALYPQLAAERGYDAM